MMMPASSLGVSFFVVVVVVVVVENYAHIGKLGRVCPCKKAGEVWARCREEPMCDASLSFSVEGMWLPCEPYIDKICEVGIWDCDQPVFNSLASSVKLVMKDRPVLLDTALVGKVCDIADIVGSWAGRVGDMVDSVGGSVSFVSSLS